MLCSLQDNQSRPVEDPSFKLKPCTDEMASSFILDAGFTSHSGKIDGFKHNHTQVTNEACVRHATIGRQSSAHTVIEGWRYCFRQIFRAKWVWPVRRPCKSLYQAAYLAVHAPQLAGDAVKTSSRKVSHGKRASLQNRARCPSLHHKFELQVFNGAGCVWWSLVNAYTGVPSHWKPATWCSIVMNVILKRHQVWMQRAVPALWALRANHLHRPTTLHARLFALACTQCKHEHHVKHSGGELASQIAAKTQFRARLNMLTCIAQAPSPAQLTLFSHSALQSVALDACCSIAAPITRPAIQNFTHLMTNLMYCPLKACPAACCLIQLIITNNEVWRLLWSLRGRCLSCECVPIWIWSNFGIRPRAHDDSSAVNRLAWSPPNYPPSRLLLAPPNQDCRPYSPLISLL